MPVFLFRLSRLLRQSPAHAVEESLFDVSHSSRYRFSQSREMLSPKVIVFNWPSSNLPYQNLVSAQTPADKLHWWPWRLPIKTSASKGREPSCRFEQS